MTRLALMACHYGAEYIAHAIRGVADAVDEIHVFYTDKPSYGFATDIPNPDSFARLNCEVHRFDDGKAQWHRGNWTSEQDHRINGMHAFAKKRGADMYIVIDADEVWAPGVARHTMDAVWRANCAGRWLCHFLNFWRSFYWIVEDQFRPVRIVDLRHPLTVDAYTTHEMQPEPVYHFGYAQSLELMRYKMACHGHRAEFRNPRWVDEVYAAWKPGMCDVHPCVIDLHNPKPTPPEVLARLGDFMSDHPYYERDSLW